MELAVAAGILWETQQLPIPSNYSEWIIYGELNLDGTVQQPEDLIGFNELCTKKMSHSIITGNCRSNLQRPWLTQPIGNISHLRYLHEPDWIDEYPNPKIEAPDFSGIYLTPKQAELALIAALGRHSLLMAGPAGSGKSLMGELIHSLGSDPSESMQKDLWRRRQQQNDIDETENLWRPLIRPHHSVTTQGLIGGGNPIRPGELARAHNGTLILDELLEFKPTTIEALREPLETNKIRLARVSGYHAYDCQFHFMATTNLCPCGDFAPKTPIKCRYSLTKCRSYSQKLTGPLVDRFQILNFSHQWKGERSVRYEDLKQKIQQIRFCSEEDRIHN